MRIANYTLFILVSFFLGTTKANEGEPRGQPDLMSFAQGAYPIEISGDANALKITPYLAMRLIDGDPTGFVLTPKPAVASNVISLTFQLPAPTVFDKFAIPNVLETPSPSQTFVRHVRISGAIDSLAGPFSPIANIELTTHSNKGEMTEITVDEKHKVRWVKVEFSAGIDEQREKMFLEFSELMGYGTQDPAPLQEGFGGRWKGRGVKFSLQQQGAIVQGCYDADGEMAGTVAGPVLRATGESLGSGVASVFVMSISEKGMLTVVRSTNGAPFRLFEAQQHDGNIACAPPEPKALGCGSIIHGITFGFDSAEILPSAEPLLDELRSGLSESSATKIVIQGHTSNEGSDAYNQALSQRRADSVVAALAARGLANPTLQAVGLGEAMPIADNTTEAGRSLNRRVEVSCE